VVNPRIKPIYDDSGLPADYRSGGTGGEIDPNTGLPTGATGVNGTTSTTSNPTPSTSGSPIAVHSTVTVDGEVVGRASVNSYVRAGLP
jgi:hypothetical protein